MENKEYIISAEYWDNEDWYSLVLGVCHMEAEAKFWLEALRNHEDWAWKAVYAVFGENVEIPYQLMFYMKPVSVLSFAEKHKNV